MNRAAYRRCLSAALLVALVPWAGCSEREMPTEAVLPDVGVASALQGDAGLQITPELILRPSDWDLAEAWGVNNYGVVVGSMARVYESSYGTFEIPDAFQWTRADNTWAATQLRGTAWYQDEARDVNDNGTVVGFGMTSPGGGYYYGYYGFSWDDEVDEVVKVLLPPSGYSSYAFAVNSEGNVVGQETVSATVGSLGVKWSTAGPTATLSGEDGTGEGTAAGARDISDAGEIVGWAATEVTTSPPEEAVVWEPISAPDYLDTLEGDTYSQANGINAPGEGTALIVGFSQDASGGKRPVIWVDKVISVLPTLGGSTGEAFAVNDHGYAVGESVNGGGRVQATLWLPDGARTAVGLPFPSDVSAESSHARDINDSGMIVGFIADGEYDRTAIVWQIEDYSPTPPGASDPLEALRAEITELEGSGALNHGQANSLMKKVENAEKKYEQCNDRAGDNILRAFINEVEALVRSGQLPKADGDRLIDLAEQAIEQPEPEHCG